MTSHDQSKILTMVMVTMVSKDHGLGDHDQYRPWSPLTDWLTMVLSDHGPTLEFCSIGNEFKKKILIEIKYIINLI